MRLTEMRQDEWTKVAPYVDTLCLPVYRTAFSEKRIRLEERRVVEAVADRVERALTGRLLLLPAIAYEGGTGKPSAPIWAMSWRNWPVRPFIIS